LVATFVAASRFRGIHLARGGRLARTFEVRFLMIIDYRNKPVSLQGR
jgi:hypothetical protein